MESDVWGWGDGPVSKNTCCVSTGPEFRSLALVEPQCRGKQRQEDHWACWSSLSSGFSERPRLREVRLGVREKDLRRPPLASKLALAHPMPHDTHEHTHVHIHTQIHTSGLCLGPTVCFVTYCFQILAQCSKGPDCFHQRAEPRIVSPSGCVLDSSWPAGSEVGEAAH